MSTLLLASF